MEGMAYFAFATLGFAVGCIFLISVDAWCRKINRKDKELMKLGKENLELKKQLDNPLRGYCLDLKECEESHLPGDCPLCGAN